MENRLLKAGTLAKATGKTLRTIHYYEEIGLIKAARRTDGGFRLFTPDDINRVRMIGHLQELGMPLLKIREAVASWEDGKNGVEAARRLRALYQDALAETRRKREGLAAMEADLLEALRFLDACGGCGDDPSRSSARCAGRGAPRGASPL